MFKMDFMREKNDTEVQYILSLSPIPQDKYAESLSSQSRTSWTDLDKKLKKSLIWSQMPVFLQLWGI